MKYILFIVIVAWSSIQGTNGGVHTNIEKLGEFWNEKDCKEVGEDLKRKLTYTGYIRSEYTCVPQGK